MPYPVNVSYEDLAEVLAPRSLSFLSNAAFRIRLLLYRITAGKTALQAAVSGGQYTHPNGLLFGGTFETWSNKVLRSIIQRYLPHSTSVIAIDIHTGLGAYGAAEIIPGVSDDSPEHRHALDIWGLRYLRSASAGASVSIPLDASLKLAIPQMLPKAEVTAVTLEFGTAPPMQVLKALREENWLHQHGGHEHRRAGQQKTRLLRLFHPDSDQWEESVWGQGVQVVERALASLEH